MQIRFTLVGIGLAVAQLPILAQTPTKDVEAELMAFLNTEVVVASKASEKLSDAPGVISVLTKDELTRFGGTTLAEILNRVPGLLNVSSYFTERSMFTMPGDNVNALKSNLHVLVLIDGRPVREVQEGGLKSDVYESFPVAAIDHIEVIKGPGSVLYGSEAFSGVINVVTDKAKKTGGIVEGALGPNSAYTTSGKVDIKQGDFLLTVVAQKAKTPDWNVNFAYKERLEPENPFDPNSPMILRPHLVIPFNHTQKKDGAFLKTSYKNFTASGAYFKFDTPFMIQDYYGDVAGSIMKKAFIDIGYVFPVTNRLNVTANLTYNRSWFDCYSIPTALQTSPNIKRDSDEILAEITGFITITDNFKLTIGELFSKATGEESSPGEIIPHSKGSRKSQALYSQLEYSIKDVAKFIGGFQLLGVGDSKSTVVPRLGIIWHPTQKIHFKALYGQAFRAPYINENFIDFGGFLRGDKALKPEIVKTLQFSAGYTGTSGEIQLNYIDSRQSDLIGFVYVPSPAGLQYKNQGTLGVKGWELEGKYYFNKYLMFIGSILAQKPITNEENSASKYTGYSNFGAKAGISYSGNFGVVSLFNIHQGSLSEELYDPSSQNPKCGTHDILNLHAKLNINHAFNLNLGPKFEAYLQGDNLLKKELWTSAISSRDWPTSIPFKKGRVFYGGLKATF